MSGRRLMDMLTALNKACGMGPLRGGRDFLIKGTAGPALVCEGIATTLSLHEATGPIVVIAIPTVNLEAVARMVRDRHPARQNVIYSDYDSGTEEKTGNTPESDRHGRQLRLWADMAISNLPTDFNDLHIAEDLDADSSGCNARPTVSLYRQLSHWRP